MTRASITTPYAIACALLLTLLGCGDDGGAGADAPTADASIADAGPADATPRCPAGDQFFTGDYLDWDSTDEMFVGVFNAVFTDEDDPARTASTAPNGRVELCLPASPTRDVSVVQPSYLTARYRVDDAANAAGPFQIRGLTLARADALFADELGLARDPAAAQVLIAVRRYPDGAPLVGATVTVDAIAQGSFTAGPGGLYGPGATTTDDAYVFVANASVSGAETAISITPPPGTVCVGTSALPLRAGEVSMTTVACTSE